MELTTTSPEFVAWLAGCQKITDDYRSEHYPTLERETLTAEDGGKLIKIVRNMSYGGRSVYAFVAKCDNHTKFLGDVKCGDVLKPATWKAPAKHARGNLFDSHKGLSKINWHGPMYL